MKNNGLTAAGLCIGVGILLASIVVSSSITKFREQQRQVTVRGLSERDFPADRVIWPIVFKEVNNNLSALYSSLENDKQIVIDFLKQNEIRDDEYTIDAPQIIDFQAERYVQSGMPYRYNGTSVIIVSTDKVDKVRELITKIAELSTLGVAIAANESYEHPIIYDFTRLNEVKPEMVEEATKNARLSAEKFAEDSDSRLGKIKTASQGQMSMYDRDQNTPYIKTLRVVSTVTYFLKD